MNYTNYTASDFICDESFLRYFLKSDNIDVVFWQNWIIDHPEKSDAINEAIQMLEVLALDLPKTEFEQELVKMEDHVYDKPIMELSTLRLTRQNDPEPKRRSIGSLLGVASIVLALVAVTAVILLSRNGDHVEPKQVPVNQLITKRNSNGQKSQLQLSDGSIVYLNSGSEIQLFDNFTGTSREVRLKGEAFFEVAHNPNKPFIVTVDKLSVRALGTSFNVRAFGETSDVAVALVDGKVEVSVKENEEEEKSLLTTGEGLIYNTNDLSITKWQFDPETALAWKNGILNFKNASWNEVESTLTRWYDVKFSIHNAPRKESPFTGEFDNLSLELVLESLSFTKNFDYKIEGKKVEIKFINQLNN